MRDWPDDPMGVRAADLAAAATDVRRFRSRRRVAAATVSVLAVAAALSSRLSLGVSTSSLVPASDSVPGPVVGAPRVAVPSATAVPPAVATGPRGPGGPVTADPPLDARDVRDPRESPEPSGGPRPPGKPQSGEWVRSYVRTGAEMCELVPDSDPGFCGMISLSQQDGVARLWYRACPRQPRVTTTALEFTDDREVELVMTDAQRREVWRWSEGQRITPGYHQVPVGAGECVRWDTVWRLGTRDGSPLPPGAYLITAYGQDTAGLLPRMHINVEVTG